MTGKVKPQPQHGTPGAYTNHRCRCQACRRAWTAYIAAYRARKRAAA